MLKKIKVSNKKYKVIAGWDRSTLPASMLDSSSFCYGSVVTGKTELIGIPLLLNAVRRRQSIILYGIHADVKYANAIEQAKENGYTVMQFEDTELTKKNWGEIEGQMDEILETIYDVPTLLVFQNIAPNCKMRLTRLWVTLKILEISLTGNNIGAEPAVKVENTATGLPLRVILDGVCDEVFIEPIWNYLHMVCTIMHDSDAFSRLSPCTTLFNRFLMGVKTLHCTECRNTDASRDFVNTCFLELGAYETVKELPETFTIVKSV